MQPGCWHSVANVGHFVAGVGHSVVSMVHGHNPFSKQGRIAELWEEISRDVVPKYMCLYVQACVYMCSLVYQLYKTVAQNLAFCLVSTRCQYGILLQQKSCSLGVASSCPSELGQKNLAHC